MFQCKLSTSITLIPVILAGAWRDVVIANQETLLESTLYNCRANEGGQIHYSDFEFSEVSYTPILSVIFVRLE
jgi:hypothetical protein